MSPHVITFTGRIVNPFNLQDSDVCVEDIAHALALVNRFGGHTKSPISVAQHSVWVSRVCATEHAMQALMHDASEAYLTDIPKWIKESDAFSAYRAAEHICQSVVYKRFGISQTTAPSVKAADRMTGLYEGLIGYSEEWINYYRDAGYMPLTPDERALFKEWKLLDWRSAETLFLSRFYELLS